MICQTYPNVDSTGSDNYDGSGNSTIYITPVDLYCVSYSTNCIKDEIPEELKYHDYGFPKIREKQEHLFALLIVLMFNIYQRKFIYRCMFSKSEYCGRVAKRRKGR